MTYPPRNPRGVIFSAPMILALLAGTKTQTRRLATSPLRRVQPCDSLWVRESFAYVGTTDPGWLVCRASYEDACRRHGFDEPYPDPSTIKWTPSIHMPRKASRMTLVVDQVRFQRLHDITEADARAEGIEQHGRFFGPPGADWDDAELSALAAFRRLWDSLHGAPVPIRDPETKKVTGHAPNPARWDANPALVALTFEVAYRNIDNPRPL